MTEINLASKIEQQLPSELIKFVRTAGKIATNQNQELYLVGGVVRDLLLRRHTYDLDLAVEGDVLALVKQLPQIEQAKLTVHPRFGTAKLQWSARGGWSIDFATARSETYACPGALPTVKPGTIKDDLFRRDFTINAMAVSLNPSHYGEMIDLYGGRDDLERKLIRILHDRSFIDDATRIWRALRYEQRLDFRIDDNTLRLLKRDIPMLDTISGDRLRYELECILNEELPEKVFSRAAEVGVLSKLHPAVTGNGRLADKFAKARRLTAPDPPPRGLYLTLLTYPLTQEQVESLISYLRFPKAESQVLRDTISIKEKLASLADPGLKPSQIYRQLHGYGSLAVTATSIATDSEVTRERIQLFLKKLRYVKTSLTGDDLIKMGIEPGPRIKEVLERLRDARLDGEIITKDMEISTVLTLVPKH